MKFLVIILKKNGAPIQQERHAGKGYPRPETIERWPNQGVEGASFVTNRTYTGPPHRSGGDVAFTLLGDEAGRKENNRPQYAHGKFLHQLSSWTGRREAFPTVDL